MGKIKSSIMFSIYGKFAKAQGEQVYDSSESKKYLQSVNLDSEGMCSIVRFTMKKDVCVDLRRLLIPRVIDPKSVAATIHDGSSYLFTSTDPFYGLLREISEKIRSDVTSAIIEKFKTNKGYALAHKSQFANIHDLPPAEHCVAVAAAKLRDLALEEWRTKTKEPLDCSKIREFILGDGFKMTHEEIVEYYLREVINDSLFEDSLKYADMFYNILKSTNLLHVFDKK